MIRTVTLINAGLLMAQHVLAGSAYVGGTVGISSTQIDKGLVYPLYTSAITTHQFSSQYKGVHGQLFLGRRFDFSRLPFAVQGDFDGFTNSAKDNLNNYFLGTPAAVQERLKYGFGLFLLPQMQLNEQVELFAGPGFVTGHFLTNSSYTGGTLGATGKYTNWLFGWGVKAGLANHLKNNWDLLFAYQYNQYQSVTYASLEPLSAQVLQANYSPNSSMFSLGTRYSFDGQVNTK